MVRGSGSVASCWLPPARTPPPAKSCLICIRMARHKNLIAPRFTWCGLWRVGAHLQEKELKGVLMEGHEEWEGREGKERKG